MVGELKAALESAGRDAAVEKRGLLIQRFLLASDRKRILLHVDLDVLLAESGDRHSYAVFVLGKRLDVVEQVCVGLIIEAGNLVKHGRQVVKSDGRTIERG